MATVLIVDDDPDFVEVTRTVLLKEGFDVLTASDGEQALQVTHEQHPDLVILDVMMASVLDGLNVSFEMAEDPSLRRIPIVMVSSIPNSQYAELFPTDEYIPINAWLSKPVSPAKLVETVKACLD